MKTALCLGVILLAAVPASGGTIAVEGLENGNTYLLDVRGGQIIVTPVRIIRVGTPGPVDPIDPGGPPTSEVGFVQAVARWARATGDPDLQFTAANLKAAFLTLSQQIEQRKISGVNEISGLTTKIIDIVLTGNSHWGSWRDNVSTELGRLQDAGQLATYQQYAKAYREISEGLDIVDGEGAIEIGSILKLVLAVISGNPAAITAAIAQFITDLMDGREERNERPRIFRRNNALEE